MLSCSLKQRFTKGIYGVQTKFWCQLSHYSILCQCLKKSNWWEFWNFQVWCSSCSWLTYFTSLKTTLKRMLHSAWQACNTRRMLHFSAEFLFLALLALSWHVAFLFIFNIVCGVSESALLVMMWLIGFTCRFGTMYNMWCIWIWKNSKKFWIFFHSSKIIIFIWSGCCLFGWSGHHPSIKHMFLHADMFPMDAIIKCLMSCVCTGISCVDMGIKPHGIFEQTYFYTWCSNPCVCHFVLCMDSWPMSFQQCIPYAAVTMLWLCFWLWIPFLCLGVRNIQDYWNSESIQRNYQ